MKHVLAPNNVFQRFILPGEIVEFSDRCKTTAKRLTPEEAAEYGVSKLQLTSAPAFDPLTESRIELDPVLTDETWVQQWEVQPIPAQTVADNLTEAKSGAVNKTYADVDAVHADAVGNRATEYIEAETDARAYIAAGYTGTPAVSVSSYATYNLTGQAQTNQWAADAIVAAADAMRTAQVSLRAQRFEHQAAMRAATTQAELDVAVAAWNAFIAATRTGLGL